MTRFPGGNDRNRPAGWMRPPRNLLRGVTGSNDRPPLLHPRHLGQPQFHHIMRAPVHPFAPPRPPVSASVPTYPAPVQVQANNRINGDGQVPFNIFQQHLGLQMRPGLVDLNRQQPVHQLPSGLRHEHQAVGIQRQPPLNQYRQEEHQPLQRHPQLQSLQYHQQQQQPNPQVQPLQFDYPQPQRHHPYLQPRYQQPGFSYLERQLRQGRQEHEAPGRNESGNMASRPQNPEIVELTRSPWDPPESDSEEETSVQEAPRREYQSDPRNASDASVNRFVPQRNELPEVANRNPDYSWNAQGQFANGSRRDESSSNSSRFPRVAPTSTITRPPSSPMGFHVDRRSIPSAANNSSGVNEPIPGPSRDFYNPSHYQSRPNQANNSETENDMGTDENAGKSSPASSSSSVDRSSQESPVEMGRTRGSESQKIIPPLYKFQNGRISGKARISRRVKDASWKRYMRNQERMNAILDGNRIDLSPRVVTTDRLNSLFEHVRLLRDELKRQQDETGDVESNCGNRMNSFKQKSQNFYSSYNKLCEPAVTQKKYDEMVDKFYTEMKAKVSSSSTEANAVSQSEPADNNQDQSPGPSSAQSRERPEDEYNPEVIEQMKREIETPVELDSDNDILIIDEGPNISGNDGRSSTSEEYGMVVDFHSYRDPNVSEDDSEEIQNIENEIRSPGSIQEGNNETSGERQASHPEFQSQHSFQTGEPYTYGPMQSFPRNSSMNPQANTETYPGDRGSMQGLSAEEAQFIIDETQRYQYQEPQYLNEAQGSGSVDNSAPYYQDQHNMYGASAQEYMPESPSLQLSDRMQQMQLSTPNPFYNPSYSPVSPPTEPDEVHMSQNEMDNLASGGYTPPYFQSEPNQTSHEYIHMHRGQTPHEYLHTIGGQPAQEYPQSHGGQNALEGLQGPQGQFSSANAQLHHEHTSYAEYREPFPGQTLPEYSYSAQDRAEYFDQGQARTQLEYQPPRIQRSRSQPSRRNSNKTGPKFMPCPHMMPGVDLQNRSQELSRALQVPQQWIDNPEHLLQSHPQLLEQFEIYRRQNDCGMGCSPAEQLQNFLAYLITETYSASQDDPFTRTQQKLVQYERRRDQSHREPIVQQPISVEIELPEGVTPHTHHRNAHSVLLCGGGMVEFKSPECPRPAIADDPVTQELLELMQQEQNPQENQRSSFPQGEGQEDFPRNDEESKNQGRNHEQDHGRERSLNPDVDMDGVPDAEMNDAGSANQNDSDSQNTGQEHNVRSNAKVGHMREPESGNNSRGGNHDFRYFRPGASNLDLLLEAAEQAYAGRFQVQDDDDQDDPDALVIDESVVIDEARTHGNNHAEAGQAQSEEVVTEDPSPDNRQENENKSKNLGQSNQEVDDGSSSDDGPL